MDGNLAQKTVDGTTTTYLYDYANRLIAIGTQGATTTYGYDAFGVRVLQTGTSTTTLYPDAFNSLTRFFVSSSSNQSGMAACNDATPSAIVPSATWTRWSWFTMRSSFALIACKYGLMLSGRGIKPEIA
jgi:YD repeat-containing protein